MTGRLLVTVLLLNQMSHSAGSFNLRSEKSPQSSETIFWISTLCTMYHTDAGYKHLSLEAYFANQSRKTWDFFASLSRHVNYDECQHTVSLRSCTPDFDDPTSQCSTRIFQKVQLNGKTTYVRFVVVGVRSLEILTNPIFNWNHHHRVLVLVAPEDEDLGADVGVKMMESTLRTIWTKFGVRGVFLASLERRAWTYEPFFRHQATPAYGRIVEVSLDHLPPASEHRANFNGYRIKVGLFDSPPAATKIKITEADDHTVDDFHGMDGHILGTLVKQLNFTAELFGPSDGVEYGYVMANGTFAGTLADVASRRVDISFNSQYIKKYTARGPNSDAVQFSTAVDGDYVCIIVPAAKEVPRWLRTFYYFHPPVWACFFMSLIVVSLCWRLMQYNQGALPSYVTVLLDTFMLFVGAPLKLERPQAERMLIGSLLFLGMTVMGAFTGTLYHSFTNQMFYRSINTLEELDASGITVGTSTASLVDIFGIAEDDGANERPVLRRLQRKVKYSVYNASMPTIKKTAVLRNVAAITRASTFAIVQHQYVDAEGRSQLHLVEDCPQVYHLGYLLPKNSFLVQPLGRLIALLKETGFTEFWKTKTMRNLIHRQMALNRQNEKLEEPTPFTLYDMQTCFLVWCIGLTVSTCVFLGELLVQRKSQNVK